MSDKRKREIKFLTLYNSFSSAERIEFQNYLKNNINISHRNYNRILSSIKVNDRGIVEIEGTDNGITRWNRFSELNLLAEKFLLQKSIESESISNKNLLLKVFDKKNLHSSFGQKYKKLKSEISNEPLVNYDYDQVSQMDAMYLKHLKSVIGQQKTEKVFIETSNFRMGIFLYELLELIVDIETQRKSKLLNSETLAEDIFSGLDIGKILRHLSGKSNISNKLYYLIKYLYLMYLSFNDISNKDSYLKAKRIFFRNLKLVSKEKRTEFYVYMINYNVERINLSIPGAAEEFFYLVNRKLKEGITEDLKKTYLPVNQFRNYILIAIQLRKYKWTDNFINKIGPVLPLSIRAINVNMGNALLAFARKEYAVCIELISKIDKKNPYIFIDVSVLKLKALFELKSFDECHHELKNFKEYLRKERSVNDHIIIYSKEFCIAYSLLLKLNNKPVKNNLYNIQYMILNKKFIGKKWITVKAGEIRLNKN